MESVGTRQKSDINILSNILISDSLFNDDLTRQGDIPNNENVDHQVEAVVVKQNEPQPELFKHLAFDLPLPKRKNSSSDSGTAKRRRTESSNDKCGGDDNDGKIFNYLTGTYESVKETVEDEQLDGSLEIKEEKLVFDENSLIKEESSQKALSTSESNSDNVSINVLDDIIVKDDPVEPPKLEVFDKTVLNNFANSQGQLNCNIKVDPNSEGQVNGNIPEPILTGTTKPVLKSPPLVNGLNNGASQSLNSNINGSNLDKSLLRHYLSSEVSTSKGVQIVNGKTSKSHHKLNLRSRTTPVPQSTSMKRPLGPHLEHKLILGQLWEYKCKSCSYTAKTKTELLSHIHTVHYELSNINNVVFKCFDCDTVFDERSQLETHAFLIHSMSAFKCDLHLSEDCLKNCNKCVYESILNRFRKSDRSNVLIALGGGQRTVMNLATNCGSPLSQPIVLASQPTSVLFKLLTKNECIKKGPVEAPKAKETIVILSDDETSDVSDVKDISPNSQIGTSEDNIVVLSDDEIAMEPVPKVTAANDDVTKRLVVGVKNGDKTSKTSTTHAEISCRIETGLESDVNVNMNTNDGVIVADTMEENNGIGQQLGDNNGISQEYNGTSSEAISGTGDNHMKKIRPDSALAFKCDLHSSKEPVKDCNKCVYASILNCFRKSGCSNVLIALGGGQRTGTNLSTNCGSPLTRPIVLASQPTSVLLKPLTKNEYIKKGPVEAPKVKETIVILSDDETSDVPNVKDVTLTKNKPSSQIGTSEDNIVVLSDHEILKEPVPKVTAANDDVTNRVIVDGNNGAETSKTSTTDAEISCGLELDVNMEGDNDASEIGHGHDETVENVDMSQGHNNSEVICDARDNHMEENNGERCDETRLASDPNKPKNDGAEDVPSDSDCTDSNICQAHPADDQSEDVELVATTTTSETPKLKFQCCDCRSYTAEGDLSQFRRHVAKHIGSKYHCMPHSGAKADDCPKCYYESTLSDVEQQFKRCLKCGFATEDASILEAHLCDVRCSPGDVRCFHCAYVTTRKKFLYFHAADHVQESFACEEHINKANPDACLKCVYEDCLKTAKKDVFVCEICGFKSVIIAAFDVHQCNKSCSAPYTCWDCKLDSFKTLNELRQHAVTHYKSEFRCKDHGSVRNNCSQCLYEALANSLEGNLFVCEKCSFRSLSAERFGRHSAGSCSIINRKFKCFHCNYKTDNENLLKYHCKEHHARSYACDSHDSPQQVDDDCPKCVYQKLLSWSQKSLYVCNNCEFKTFNGFHLKAHASKSHSSVPDDLSLPFQCFDCTSKFKNFRRLKFHAICHSNSTFKCTDHKSNQVMTCAKCIYENIIVSAKKGSYACKKCGYETIKWNDMKEHVSDEANCKSYTAQRKSVKRYSCFDCDFSDERLDSLKTHVKEHCASKFECDEHKSPDADCPKCRYVQLVIATARGRLFCYDCNKQRLFADSLSLRKHVVEKHGASNFACTLHVEKKDNCCSKCLYGEVVKDVVGDNYVKLICWDCDGNRLFSRMAPYEDHIVYMHSNSKFLCPEHCGKNHKRCSKCFYQKMLQRHSIIKPTSKTVTFRCFQCNYSDKGLRIFIRHIHTTHKNSNFKCKDHPDSCDKNECCPQCFYHRIKSEKPGLTPFIRCYECDLAKNWSFHRLQFMKAHIKEEHKKCEFVCTLHPNEGGMNCVKCWFEILAQSVTQKQGYRYRCFSCSYGSDDFSSFESHVHKSHKDTKFKCKEHLYEPLIDCPQCFYATVFSEACKFTTTTNNNIICYACVNPTPLPYISALEEHIVGNHKTTIFICPSHIVKVANCDKCLFQRRLEIVIEQQRSTTLKCFDCDYTTNKFSIVRYHVWQQHRDSKYRCSQHVDKTIDCRMCTYVTMIENIRNFTCYGCETLPLFSGVDPLRRHVYKVHEKNFFVCPDEHSNSSSRNACGKCSFQKLVRDVFILECQDCDVVKSFQDKDCLKKHIKEHHITSKFICKLHPLGPKWDTCSQCCYEKLLRVSLTEEPLLNTSTNEFSTFKCFDCNYETDEDVIIKWHIRNKHPDSEFTCRTHSSGEIDHACSECTYENLVLQVKDHFSLCLSP